MGVLILTQHSYSRYWGLRKKMKILRPSPGDATKVLHPRFHYYNNRLYLIFRMIGPQINRHFIPNMTPNLINQITESFSSLLASSKLYYNFVSRELDNFAIIHSTKVVIKINECTLPMHNCIRRNTLQVPRNCKTSTISIRGGPNAALS